jgi:hypothetical protein
MQGPGSFTQDAERQSANIRQLAHQEFRYNEKRMSGLDVPGLDRYPTATAAEIDSCLLRPHSDILVEIALRSHSMLDLYELTLGGYLYKLEIGDTVLLQLSLKD